MCKKCNNNKCSGCDSGSESKDIQKLKNELSEIKSVLSQISKDTKFLSCGHPILMLTEPSDIAAFDLETGLGEKCWEGWAVCTGESHRNANNKLIATPNLLDKFVVGAGDTYTVGATGGSNSVTLSSAQMPVHSHTITDPGHTHDINDPGHGHAITQENHSHGASSAAHNHGVDLSTNETGNHNHNTGFTIIGDNNLGTNFNALNDGTSGSSTSSNGLHSHTVSGNTSSVSAAVTVAEAAANITINNNSTGIEETESETTGISLGNSGEGEAHENRPPYYAVLFVMKL
jgi:microcystin-dependent protein